MRYEHSRNDAKLTAREPSETAFDVNARRTKDPRNSRLRNVHQLFNRKLLTIDSSTGSFAFVGLIGALGVLLLYGATWLLLRG